MKERPILFSGPMVRAILRGHKTQTRRVVNFGPYEQHDIGFVNTDGFETKSGISFNHFKKSYSKPGDRIWVKETFSIESAQGISKVPLYRADFLGHGEVDPPPGGTKWKPSIYMPRSLCRIVLEITNLRVQRLKDISTTDILSEGVIDNGEENLITAWKNLWDSINGDKHPFSFNPWVWAITFKVVEGGK